MPEGPEIACIAEQFSKHIGKKVEFSIRPQVYELIASQSKGKNLYFTLKDLETENIEYFHVHAKINGKWNTKNSQNDLFSIQIFDTKFCQVYYFSGNSLCTFRFLTETEYLTHLLTIGTDVFEITFPEFRKILENSRIQNSKLSEVLINQKYLAGIGNYLRSEILYTSNISPLATVGSLTERQISKCFEAICKVCNESKQKQLETKRIGHWNGEKNHCGAYDPKVYGKKFDEFSNPIRIVCGTGKKKIFTIID